MLTEDCFLPPLVQLSKPASLLASIAFFWDAKKGRMMKMDSSGLRFHKATTYIHALSVGSMLLQTAIFREKDRSKNLISSFGLIVLVFTTITVWVYHKKLHRAIVLINDLIEASNEFRDPGPRILDGTEKFIQFMAPLFHWSAMSVPFAFVGGVVWSMPCLGSSFGYLLLPECSCLEGGTSPGGGISLSWLVFIGVNLVLWCYSIQCAVFVVIGVEMLGAMSIRSFLKFYERMMLSTEAKRENSKIIYKNALMYRRLQLLADNLNSVHASYILVPLLFTVSSHQVFSTYGIIKFQGQLNFVSYALFCILASQGVLVIMGMFTALADVHTTSVRTKGRLQKAHRNHKWLRRYHAGCSIIKIRFGALNYIDSFTPLCFESFAVSQTANILLVD